MPGTVIGKSLNLGFAGKISRNVGNLIGARFVKSILDGNGAETQPSIPFGFPAVLNTDNSFSKFGASGAGVSSATAANFAGIAVSEVKQVLTYGDNATGEYTPNQPADVLETGTCTVFVADKTANAPTAGGKVYICTAAGNGTLTVGQLFAAAAPTGIGTGTVVELPNVRFTTGKVDANNITEITMLTRVNP